MRAHQFAFVGGLHKSGTSILADCLKDHPQISGFSDTGVPRDEGQHLQSVYPPAKAHGGPGKFGLMPESHLTETSPLVSEENRNRLFSEWARYWDLGKPVLVEKSPPNLTKTRFLQALFPNSYFIMIMRHPIAVSYATQAWSSTGMSSLLEHWLVCHEIFAEDKPHLTNVFVLQYENFVANPDEHLGALHSFLGLPPHRCARAISTDTNEKYFRRWQENRSRVLHGPDGQGRFEEYEKRLNRFGYSLYDLGRVAAPLFVQASAQPRGAAV